MTVWKPLRVLFIRSTDLTRGFQGDTSTRITKFYKLWAPCYDLTIRLDLAYQRQLKRVVESVVRQGDVTLDVGCGTGLGTIYAATVAKKVVGVDPSAAMLARLSQKIQRRNVKNIEIRTGLFPQVLSSEKFDSIISSFMLAHIAPEQRPHLIAEMFDCLNSGGRLGLFSAQGEIASTFQTRDEVAHNLSSAGFRDITVSDVSDIYRISTATKH